MQMPIVGKLTLSPPIKLPSARFLVCLNFQSASMSLKVGESIVRVFEYGTLVVLSGLRDKKYLILQRKKQAYKKYVLIDIAMADKRNIEGDSPVVGDGKAVV